jgi:formamidopyrimidine-DNA glycosylase
MGYKSPMPELPEVETVARDLRRLLVGRKVVGLTRSRKVLRTSWSKAWDQRIVGRRVEAVHRRGKWLLLELKGMAFLMVHLGMTGRFTVVPADARREPHTHLVFRLDSGDELRFRDARRFGSVTYFPDRRSWEAFLVTRLGPEPWDMKPARFRAELKNTRRPVKAALLDQTLVAGVGNIYADEACFAARIDPRRTGKAIRPAEADRLLLAVRTVLDRAIELKGSTIRDYVGGSGGRGGFQDEFRVYGRKGEPCPRCGTPIVVARLSGRSTHYCPHCQK